MAYSVTYKLSVIDIVALNTILTDRTGIRLRLCAGDAVRATIDALVAKEIIWV